MTTDRATLDLERPRTAAPSEVLRKPVNALAIVPKSHRITPLGRKSYNVLLYEAQEQGVEKDVYRVPLERIVKGIQFDSNDIALVKKHLRAMVSTTVEWQSPTTGEGTAWNVSGLLAHARLSKERGQVWVEWSYAVNLKQELLQPNVYARLKLEIISQMRSHAGIALYEICTRYKEIGRTARQHWRWWHPVLSGQPETEKTARLEYRIFKRDTLKPAIAEVSAITDIEVELVEHKEGRFIADIQFLVRPKKPSAPERSSPPEPVDLALIAKAKTLGLDDDRIEELVDEFGAQAVGKGVEALERRIATSFPAPLRDPYRYLRTLMPGVAQQVSTEQQTAAASAAATRIETQGRRHTRWTEEWIRRRREQLVEEMKSLPDEQRDQILSELSADMAERNVHPSIRKRLQVSGWLHPLALPEAIRFYGKRTLGADWDRPTPEELLRVAAELGDD